MAVKASISSVVLDTNDEQDSKLKIIPEDEPDQNHNENRNSSATSRKKETSSLLRPFFDPNLVTRKNRATEKSWLDDFQTPSSAPEGAYSPIAQALKSLIPERTACRFGCKGNRCKYERSDYWKAEQMAIEGIYSNWITENILACSRPTGRHEKLKERFYEAGIRAIFNLEQPDEHVLCGHGNHESGFSYNPSEFMDVGIFIYNFAMEDYGTVKTDTITDIMKVMTFAMKQGKIAVHCHAGLGRTGFIICSYLVYEYRMSAHQAIHYIRAKRPGSVQMTKQIEAVVEFERFLIPKRRIFTDCADETTRLPIDIHLTNQRILNHGRDDLIFKYIPKVVFVCAARLVSLCSGYMMETVLVTINRRGKCKPIKIRDNLKSLTEEEQLLWIDYVPSFFYETDHHVNRDFSSYKDIMSCMISSIDEQFLSSEQVWKVNELKRKINKTNHGIEEIFDETDPCVISSLMWTWLNSLRFPLIETGDFALFTENNPEHSTVELASSLKQHQRGTIEVLAKMFAYLRRFADKNDSQLLVYCIIHFLTQSPLILTENLKKITRHNKRILLSLTEQSLFHQNSSDKPEPLTEQILTCLEQFFVELSQQFD